MTQPNEHENPRRFLATRRRAYWVEETMEIEADGAEQAEDRFYDWFDPQLEIQELAKLGDTPLEEPLNIRETKQTESRAKTKPAEVCYQTSMWDCKKRQLWQLLFDTYRENGGPLGCMDSMLIDLEDCEKTIDLTLDGPQRFIWGFSPGDFMTTWIKEGPWRDEDIPFVAQISSHDLLFLCEVTEDNATLTPIKFP